MSERQVSGVRRAEIYLLVISLPMTTVLYLLTRKSYTFVVTTALFAYMLALLELRRAVLSHHVSQGSAAVVKCALLVALVVVGLLTSPQFGP